MQQCVQADLTRDAVESSVGFFLRLAFSSFRTKLACILLGSAQKTKAPFQGLGVPNKGEGFMSFSRAEIELPKRQKRRGGLCLGQRTRSRAASCSHRLYCLQTRKSSRCSLLFSSDAGLVWGGGCWATHRPEATMVTILKPPFFTGLDLGSPLLRERGSGFVNVLGALSKIWHFAKPSRA